MLALRQAPGDAAQSHRYGGARESLLVARSSFALHTMMRRLLRKRSQQLCCRADIAQGSGGGGGGGGRPASLAALATLARTDPEAVEWIRATVVENR